MRSGCVMVVGRELNMDFLRWLNKSRPLDRKFLSLDMRISSCCSEASDHKEANQCKVSLPMSGLLTRLFLRSLQPKPFSDSVKFF